MATESCPRCGEKAISQTGHCVFCGAVVVAPKIAPSGKDFEKSLKAYQWISSAFIVMGVLYFILGVAGTILKRTPMLGLFSIAFFTITHGVLLIKRNDWIQSVTKVVCGIRLFVLVLILLVLLPYMALYGPIVLSFCALFVLDIVCLMQMIRTIDDVYFA